jgi:hypothetical protein
VAKVEKQFGSFTRKGQYPLSAQRSNKKGDCQPSPATFKILLWREKGKKSILL